MEYSKFVENDCSNEIYPYYSICYLKRTIINPSMLAIANITASTGDRI